MSVTLVDVSNKIRQFIVLDICEDDLATLVQMATIFKTTFKFTFFVWPLIVKETACYPYFATVTASGDSTYVEIKMYLLSHRSLEVNQHELKYK